MNVKDIKSLIGDMPYVVKRSSDYRIIEKKGWKEGTTDKCKVYRLEAELRRIKSTHAFYDTQIILYVCEGVVE